MINLRKKVQEVDVLILEDNNISHLPSRAFGSVKIHKLFIENNKIMTIDRNAFAGLEDFLEEVKVSDHAMNEELAILFFNFRFTSRNLSSEAFQRTVWSI